VATSAGTAAVLKVNVPVVRERAGGGIIRHDAAVRIGDDQMTPLSSSVMPIAICGAVAW